MSYTAHVLHGFNPLEALETEWRDLFNQAESPNPFFSAEWVFTWLNHRGGRVFPVTLIVRDGDNRLVAAWPFFEYPAIGGRGLWVSLSDIANCLEPLVIRNDDALLKTVFEALAQLLADYRFIWIPLLRGQWVRDYLEPALDTFPNLPIIRNRAPNHFIDLKAQSDFESYLTDAVGAKTRKSLRYDIRQLEQLGQVECITYRTPDDLLRFEVEMRSIEKVSWKGRERLGQLTGVSSEGFFHELLPKLMALGQAEITALRLNQMAIAFEIAGFSNPDSAAFAMNSEDNEFFGGDWSRLDWTRVDGALWYCQAVFDGVDEEAVRAAEPADASDPASSGCGAAPWTELTAGEAE